MASMHIKCGCQAFVFLALVVGPLITAAVSETKTGSGSCPEDSGESDGSCLREFVGRGNALLQTGRVTAQERVTTAEDQEDGDSEDEADEDDEETSIPDADDEIDGEADKYEEVVITDEERDAAKTKALHDDAPNILIDGKDVTEKVIDFGRALKECMQDAITEANGDEGRLKLIDGLIEYEMMEEVQVLGANLSTEFMSLVEAIASTSAQQIVHEDFKKSMVHTLSNVTLTHLVVDSFIDTFDSMARSCGEEDAATLDRDERRLLTSERSGTMGNSSSIVAFDMATMTLNQCQRDHMDVDFLAMHGATLKHHAQCSRKLSAALLEKHEQLTHQVNYDIKSFMALHNNDNGLAHHLASHFKTHSLAPNVSNPSKGEMQRKVHAAALANLKPATVAKLLYVEEKHENFLFGMSRREYCQKFSGKTDDVGARAYIKCVCLANQPSLVCRAKHSTLLSTSMHEMITKVKRAKVTYDQHMLALRGDSSSDTARSAFGPCSPPLECELCLGDECFRPSRSARRRWGAGSRRRRFLPRRPVSRRRRRSSDVFEAIANIAEQGSQACPSGSCTFAYGSPSGTCALKLQLTMGVDMGVDCSAAHNVYSNFNLFLKSEMCIGGGLGDLADAIGWGSCMTLAEIRYYMFMGKVELEQTFSAPIPLVRFTFTMKLPVHELLKPVKDYIRSGGDHDEVQRACHIMWGKWGRGIPWCLGLEVWGHGQRASEYFWQTEYNRLRVSPSLGVEVFVFGLWDWYAVDNWNIV